MPRLAFLADAHLQDGNDRRPEALALARAVGEIRSLNPPPAVVFFAGDLAHDGNPKALALGKEILADLPGPLVLVKGEGDGRGKGDKAWSRLFGEPRFSRGYGGFHLLGLYTALTPSPQGPVFEVGKEQRRWLAQELAKLESGKPLIILSHAPLVEIYRPWQQWTRDGLEVMRLLATFSRVYCFHGHVHYGAVSDQLSDFLRKTENGKRKTEDWVAHLTLTEDLRPQTENHPLPATAWPLPSPLQGTPTAPRPGLGPRGCGWALASLGDKSLTYQSRVWPA
jgi:3',5'-cyclic AMP phosphodiesterase CpdA